MRRGLDDRTKNILYHGLGAEPRVGLARFERSFLEAESRYALEDLDALLSVIGDPTLQDEQFLTWHQYFRARRELLLWRTDGAERILNDITDAHAHGARSLHPRIELLRAQTQLRRGAWSASRTTLQRALGQIRATDEPVLLADAYQTMAEAELGQAHTSGGWYIPSRPQAAMTVVLLPLYLPLLLGLWLAGMQPFCRPALRFGGDFSNWPVFQHFLNAFRSLRKARLRLTFLDEGRRFHLEMMWAGLLRDLTDYPAARSAYRTMLEAGALPAGGYREALVKHGLAATSLLMDSDSPGEKVVQDLAIVRKTYLDCHDQRAVAHVDLLLGDVDQRQGRASAALQRWQSAMHTFQAQDDPSGLAEALDRCYRALDAGLPKAEQEQARDIVRSVGRQIFTARLPSRTFALIQTLGWLVPLAVAVFCAAWFASFADWAETEDYWLHLRLVVSRQGLGVLAVIFLAVMLTRACTGIVGLLSSLWTTSTHLDYFEVGQESLSQYDYMGIRHRVVPWSAVDCHLRVERGVLFRPSRLLSFDCLRTRDGQVMRIPGTIRWFPHLQQAVDERLGQSPRVYKMQLQGGAIALYAALGLCLAFLLTVSAFGQQISTSAYAWAATAASLVGLVPFAIVTGRWCVHYARVSAQTLPSVQFTAGAASLGVLLLLGGLFGRRVLFPLGSFMIGWGAVFVSYTIAHLRKRAESRAGQIAGHAAQVFSVLAGALLVVYTFVPATLRLQGFTYQNALYRLGQERPADDANRDHLFQQLCSSVEWMPRWDPVYVHGHYYQGVCRYHRGEHAASLSAYGRAIDLAQSQEVTWPDLYHCRALVYYALGEPARADQDLQKYEDLCTKDCDMPDCLGFFPESREFWDPVSD